MKNSSLILHRIAEAWKKENSSAESRSLLVDVYTFITDGGSLYKYNFSQAQDELNIAMKNFTGMPTEETLEELEVAGDYFLNAALLLRKDN